MKKTMIVLLLSIMATAAYAQKGMNGIGANLALQYYCADTEGIGFSIDIKYQYNIANWYRIEPFIGLTMTEYYDSYNYKESSFAPDFRIGVNNHFFFLNKIRRFRPYAIVGLAYCNYLADFNFSPGVGLDIRLSHRSSLQIEFLGNISIYDDHSIQLAVGYTFNF